MSDRVLLIVAILMGAISLVLLISFPLLIIWYCCKNRKMKRTLDLQQPLRREENGQTGRVYEIAPIGTMTAQREADTTTTETDEVATAVYDTVQGTTSQSCCSTQPKNESASRKIATSSPNDPHKVYHILTCENTNPNGERGPETESVSPTLQGDTGNAELGTMYDVVMKKDPPTSPDTKEAIYSILDHTKPQGDVKGEDYSTLQHAKKSRLAHSVSDSHVPPMGVYETIGKPGAAQATVRPGQPVYSSLGTPRYSLVNRKTKSSSAMEGIQRETGVQLNTTSTTATENSKKIPARYPSVLIEGMRRKISTTSATIPEEADATLNMHKPPPTHYGAKQEEERTIDTSLTHLPKYEVVTKLDPATSSTADTTKEVYSALDHIKPQSRQNSSNLEEDYNTLQHAKNSRLAHSVSDTHVPLYDTIDKPRTAQATLPPGDQPVYSSLENSRHRKSKSTSTVEVQRKGKTEPDHTLCLGEPITKSTAENLGPVGMEKQITKVCVQDLPKPPLPPRRVSQEDQNRGVPATGRESNPTRKESNPTGKESNPTGKESNPTGGESNPTRKESNPIGKESNPTGGESNPTGRESNPTRRELPQEGLHVERQQPQSPHEELHEDKLVSKEKQQPKSPDEVCVG
jgi:hypothetical protein